jgi:hypothetical protein
MGFIVAGHVCGVVFQPLFIPKTGEKFDFLILADRKYTFILQ